MLDRLFSSIAPYACISCSRLGRILCDPCTDDICVDRRSICIGCGFENDRGICAACTPEWPAERAIVCTVREGIVKTLINDYKFSGARSAALPLAAIAGTLLPHGMTMAVVPLPTIRRHIRLRGYDHTALIARRLARGSGRSYAPVLMRRGHAVQRGASKKDRFRQVASAFVSRGPLDPDTLYVLVDDIVTTGASLRVAACELERAGARRVWVLAIARQPLRKE